MNTGFKYVDVIFSSVMVAVGATFILLFVQIVLASLGLSQAPAPAVAMIIAVAGILLWLYGYSWGEIERVGGIKIGLVSKFLPILIAGVMQGEAARGWRVLSLPDLFQLTALMGVIGLIEFFAMRLWHRLEDFSSIFNPLVGLALEKRKNSEAAAWTRTYNFNNSAKGWISVSEAADVERLALIKGCAIEDGLEACPIENQLNYKEQ